MMCEGDKDLYEVALTRRSIRQFKPDPVPRELLEKAVNAARLAPSGANIQPLEYVVVEDDGIKKEIFAGLKWAASIAPEGNPRAGREPAAYIVVLVDTELREKLFEYDVGAAMENTILTAWSEGVGSCWLLNIDRDRLRSLLGVPGKYRIDSVLALGYPDEEPQVEVQGDSCRYWKDAEGLFHVPKRKLEDVLHRGRF
jgi:nitroreductase